MSLIILGLALWWAAHLFKRLAPNARARLGDGGRALMAVAVVASVVLMVVGYRGVAHVDLWYPPGWLTHVNNVLMAGALFLLAADGMRAPVVGGMRHPMLIAFKIWAVAHLLVNGDLASVVLFGGLLAWAVVSVIVINRSEPNWSPKPVKPGATPKVLVAAAIALVGIMQVHNWLGVQPWGG